MSDSGLKNALFAFISMLCSIFLCLTLASQTASAGQTFTPIEINDQSESLALDHNLWVLEDKEDQFTIEAITTSLHSEFRANPVGTPNFGQTNSSFWIGMTLNYQGAQQEQVKNWLLELSFPLLQKVELYAPDHLGNYQRTNIGYDIAQSDRAIPHRNFLFPLRLESNNPKTIYLNIMRKGGAVQAPLTLRSQERMLEDDGKSNYFFGIFFGVMASMILYNTFLFLSVRWKAYFFYILYITSTALTFQCITGYGFLYFWPTSPELNRLGLPVIATTSTILAFAFFRQFLNLPTLSKTMNRICLTFMLLGGFLIIALITAESLLSAPTIVYVSVSCFLVLSMAIIAWRKESRPAFFFLLAWTTFLLGALSYTFSLLGIFPSNSLTTHGVQIGSVAEVILLALGLADRINRERKERYFALQDQHEAMVKLKQAEDRLVHRALHSRTTGLPNRALLRRSLDQYLAESYKDGFIGLFLVSLDNFHEFNKTLGHSNGDAILKLVTSRLSNLISTMGNSVVIDSTPNNKTYLAVAEGVTFAFVLNLDNENQAIEQANLFLRAFEKPFEYQKMTLDIESTIGVALYPDHGDNTDGLLRNAHIALEAANTSNDKVAIYTNDIDPYSAKRLSLIAELKHAIENDGLQLYFQPQLCLTTGKIAGAEVLIRWIHPEHGFIPPDDFIPLAERTGVIHPLTQWICKEAFSFLSRLNQAGYDLSLSINISARNLQDKFFKEAVAALAKNANIPVDRIVMELTETAVMVHPEEAMRVMRELSTAGFRLSIDDFGTGYSSLAYLKQLPVKELKIDRTFVMEMSKNNNDQVIVNTTLQMGHNLGLEIVAEGIEDQATLDSLTSMKCDLAQGYHIARPMPESDFINWLENFEAKPGITAAVKN